MTGATCHTIAIVGRWVAGLLAALLLVAACGAARSQTIAACLDQVNAKRASMGLYPLQLNLACQAQAERESVERARRRITGHLRNGCSPGRAEGVGYRGGSDPYGQQFLTCFHAPRDYTRRHQEAGAAVATDGRGRTYYTLILR